MSHKEKFNKKHGQPLGTSNSIAKVARLSGISKKAAQDIYNKGIGAYKTNPSSVRPQVKSKEQWAMARLYSAVTGGKAAKVDKNELKEGKKAKTKPKTKSNPMKSKKKKTPVKKNKSY